MSGEWSLEDLIERVHGIVRDEILSVGGDFSPRSNLIEAGLDSLAVTQLMLSIEESTGVWVDESLLTPENLESSVTLATLVYEQLRSG
jgi:acyl carrier protein